MEKVIPKSDQTYLGFESYMTRLNTYNGYLKNESKKTTKKKQDIFNMGMVVAVGLLRWVPLGPFIKSRQSFNSYGSAYV